jgi:hypothetical protein
MQKGRAYLRVLLLASAMVLGSGSLGESQAGVDQTTVNARAAAIAADIDARISKTQNEDAKKCLREKKTAVNNLKASVATAADLSTLLGQINEVAGQLDTCTSGPGGGPSQSTTGTGSSPAAGAQVQVETDPDTPDPNESNPSVIIPPGPTASGPGVIGEGGGGPDFGGGDTGGDDDIGTQPPVIPPPPVSPTI